MMNKKVPLLLCFLLLLVFHPLKTSAHAVLLKATPEEQSELKEMPDEVSLTFNERLDGEVFDLKVRDDKGEVITKKKAVISEDHKTISLDVPNQSKGIYTLSYSIVSADGHPVKGTYIFSVGEKIAGPASDSNDGFQQGSDIIYNILLSIVQVCYYLFLLLSVGWVLWKWFIPFQTKENEETYGQKHKGIYLNYMVFLVLSIVVQAMNVLNGSSASQIGAFVFSSATGLSWIISLFLAFIGYFLVSKHKGFDFVWAGLVLLVSTLNGHAVATNIPYYTVMLDFIHLITAALWAGGIVYLLLFFKKHREDVLLFMPKFSKTALFSLLLLIITGILYTLVIVPSISMIFHTTWGILLLVKVGLVSIVLIIGAMARNALKKNEQTNLKKLLTLDVTLMALIVIIVGIITHLNPIPQNQPLLWKEEQQGMHIVTKTSTLQQGNFAIVVSPSQPKDGSSIQMVTATLTPKGKGKEESIEIPLEKEDSSSYKTSKAILPYVGEWDLSVRVVTTELDEFIIHKNIQVFDH
ncbi:copper resistance protein CopC/CopD [Bacillus sp. JZ8]